MSRLTNDMSQRMREAFTIEMSPATKQTHASSIGEALTTAGGAPLLTPISWWRRSVPALGAVLLVVLPVGTAIAAESTLPGDLLYPVKRVVEPVRSIIDSDVAAQHRVDELERFLDGPVVSDRLPDALRDARDAVSDLPLGHDLRLAFDRLTDRVTVTPPSDVAPPRDADEVPPGNDAGTDRQLTDVPDSSDEPEPHPHEGDSRPDEPHVHEDTGDDIGDRSTTTEPATKRDDSPRSDR